MKYVSLRHSIALPCDQAETTEYWPDGLNETEIDRMLTESGMDVELTADETDPDELAPVAVFPDDDRRSSAHPSGDAAA